MQAQDVQGFVSNGLEARTSDQSEGMTWGGRHSAAHTNATASDCGQPDGSPAEAFCASQEAPHGGHAEPDWPLQGSSFIQQCRAFQGHFRSAWPPCTLRFV